MDFKALTLFKKILVIIYLVLLLVLLSPLLLFVGILILIKVPFEYPKYKKSRYYKKFKQKYYVGITSDYSYNIINYLEKEKINYDSFNYEKDELVIGNTTYLFPWFEYISYNEDGKCIIAEQDDYEPTLLCEDSKIKDRKNIKILIYKEDLKEIDLNKARKDKMLIIYNKLSDLRKELK